MALATNTIPAGWKPASSGCQDRSDNWVWADGTWVIAVLGSPDQTSSCYPPDFTPTLGHLYTASSCPDGFTPACTTNYYSSSWSTLCCPQATGNSPYSCEYKSFWSWTLPCVTAMYSYSTELMATATYFSNAAQPPTGTAAPTGDNPVASATWTTSTITSTYMTTSPSTQELHLWRLTYDEGQRLWALGVAISPPGPTSSGVSASSGGGQPTTSTTTTEPGSFFSSESGDGLSAPKVGLVATLGVAAVFLIVLVTGLVCHGVITCIKKKRRDGGGAGEQRHPAPEEQKLGPSELAGEQVRFWRRPDEYVPQWSPVELHETVSPRRCEQRLGEPHELP